MYSSKEESSDVFGRNVRREGRREWRSSFIRRLFTERRVQPAAQRVQIFWAVGSWCFSFLQGSHINSSMNKKFMRQMKSGGRAEENDDVYVAKSGATARSPCLTRTDMTFRRPLNFQLYIKKRTSIRAAFRVNFNFNFKRKTFQIDVGTKLFSCCI